MRTRITSSLLLIIWVSVITIFLFGDSFAFWNDQKVNAESSAAEVTKITNERLNRRVDELSKEKEQLKNDLAKLQGDIYGTKRDRDQLLDKLKMIAQENAKLKEQITYLDVGIVKVDAVRNDLEREKKALAEKITQLEDKLASFIAKDNETNNSTTEITPGGDKKTSISAKKVSLLEQIRGELAQHKRKTRELEKSLQAALNQEKATTIKMLEDKNTFVQQQTSLKNAISRLKKNAIANKKEITQLRKALKETKENLFLTAKEIEDFKKEAVVLHYNLGVILQDQANWESAIEEYQKVIALKPNDADAHFNLALIYDKIKNERKKAIDHYRAYLDIKPQALDAAQVKECIASLDTERGIWGDPNAKGIKEKLGRW